MISNSRWWCGRGGGGSGEGAKGIRLKTAALYCITLNLLTTLLGLNLKMGFKT